MFHYNNDCRIDFSILITWPFWVVLGQFWAKLDNMALFNLVKKACILINQAGLFIDQDPFRIWSESGRLV